MEIQGYNGRYLIYEDGRVWSNYSKGKFLKPCDNGVGYYRVDLNDHSKRKWYYIHRLVAIHYIPNPDNLVEVDHIDRNPSNNDISNLRWVTRSQNCQNKVEYKNNTSGHKNITKSKNGWLFYKTINKKIYQKWFKTLEEAIEYKKEYLTTS